MEAPPLSSVMSHPLVSVTPRESLSDAARLMVRHRIRHLPVLEEGKIVGVLSARDIQKALRVPLLNWSDVELKDSDFRHNPSVEQYMSFPVESVDVSTPLGEAAARMLELRFSALIVTRDGRPEGIVTTDDFLRILAESARPGKLRGWLERVGAGYMQSPIGLFFEELQSSGI